MNKEEQYDLIDRHLRGELSEDEITVLKDKKRSDRSFAQEIELHKEIQFVLADQNFQEFKTTIKRADQDYFSRPAHLRIPSYLKIAATIILIASISITLFLSQPGNTGEELFEHYFTAYEAPSHFRGNLPSTTSADNWNKAISLYEQENYKAAILVLSEVIGEYPANQMALLIRGVSHLALGSTQSADKDFMAIIDHRYNAFVKQAQWYLALSYLRQGRYEDAKMLLNSLKEGNVKAQKILDQL